MAILDVELLEESKNRYLTYALSVVSSRALPDVRDGLKPVQRRILYAMFNNLHLGPDKHHRKSAAVVGEVLARYHPHGDSACYDALVRMAQDFSLRYPLIDGQGNFGSLDGDSAAAYRYTEAKLTPMAVEVVGDIGEDTVSERENFDQTTKEPVVLPSRVPNLLINGASGIAVGVATSIPPHNLNDVIKALLVLLEDSDVTDAKLINAVKAPDFPTGCAIVNSREEIKRIYTTGRGAITMRGTWGLEPGLKGKRYIIVTSVPYGIDKSVLIEKIADLIIARKVPQLEDIRDESTEEVRIVLELAKGADPEVAMAYLFKNTILQNNFNVNLTALVPTENPYSGRPELLGLRSVLEHFIVFRVDVTRAKLLYEKRRLEERIHLLQGLVLIFDALDEAIAIVRASEGRADGAKKLAQRFSLSMEQALFVVDLRIYQLAHTAIEEVEEELRNKLARVAEIDTCLVGDSGIRKLIADDLRRLSEKFGDKRKSVIEYESAEIEFDAEEYVQHEDVHVIVTKDGWLKRIRETNDPASTRIREGDSLFFVQASSTRNSLALFTNHGNVFVVKIHELSQTTGYGEPVQKLFRFQDGENVIQAMVLDRGIDQEKLGQLVFYTARGFGYRFSLAGLSDTKKTGRKLVKISEGDELAGLFYLRNEIVFFITAAGYVVTYLATEVPELSGAGKGVILQKIPSDDALVAGCSVSRSSSVSILTSDKEEKSIGIRSLTLGSRAKRGNKLIKRGLPVIGIKI